MNSQSNNQAGSDVTDEVADRGNTDVATHPVYQNSEPTDESTRGHDHSNSPASAGCPQSGGLCCALLATDSDAARSATKTCEICGETTDASCAQFYRTGESTEYYWEHPSARPNATHQRDQSNEESQRNGNLTNGTLTNGVASTDVTHESE
ncbi:hypothetical protein BD324DRAFT_154426 [Kockovaella imperatae]|uniref:Uncharacterized protein n=1 Tax=Kockovaella imperatae TaxID=4999 RepID=A0A1Y1UBN2_9TREE|nr:hypothetical protein BD324DRAFT_154426 [Kockovaella imperatae]ORX34495.1 hypothetical protein BD324DRAFT_154426 [Kockovaella imperatae]